MVAVVRVVVSERVVFVLCPQRKTAGARGMEGRTDTWGDRIRGRGSDARLRLKETIRKLSQPKT